MGTLCRNIKAKKHLRVINYQMEQLDQTQREERKKLHTGIAIITTVVFTMSAYECEITDYTLSGWLASISIATTFIATIAYNVFRVLKLDKSL